MVFDYAKRYPEGIQQLAHWIREGKLKTKFHIEQGPVDKCPDALAKLFKGVNTGKM